MGKKRGNGMGRFSVEFEVANRSDMNLAKRGVLPPEKVRRIRIEGVVDPGATRLVLPGSVAKRLGLEPAGRVEVRYADDRTAIRSLVEDVFAQIQGRGGVYSALVEPRRKSALIGAIVLEDLDLLVDCAHQKLVPRDPRFIVTEAESLRHDRTYRIQRGTLSHRPLDRAGSRNRGLSRRGASS